MKDNHNIIDDLNELNINDQLVENGIIMPKNSIFTKENEIKEYLFKLFFHFLNLFYFWKSQY